MPKSATATIQQKTPRRGASSRSLSVPLEAKRPKDLLAPSRREDALKRLGISEEAIERMPQITPMLAAIGGHQAIINTLRYSIEPAACAFLDCYDKLPKGDRESLPIEAIAIKANVGMLELLGTIMLAAKNKNGQESALLAITSHPEVLRKTIEYAELPGGIQDRRLLHEAVNFVASKKGFNMNFHFGSQPNKDPNPAAPVEPEEEEDESTDDESPIFNNLFPMVTRKLDEWGDIRNRLLESK